MKKLKKVMSLLLVGVIAVTSLFCGTVTASAASSYTSLIKASLSTIDSKATGIQALGQDLYILYNNDTGYRAICRIGSDEINSWRSTGKLKATKITVDKKITGSQKWTIASDTTFENGNYSTLAYTKNGEDWYGSAVKYNKAKNSITQYYTSPLADGGFGVSSNGTVAVSRFDEKTKSGIFDLINTTGKKFKTVSIDLKNFSDDGEKWGWTLYQNGKYIVIYTGGWSGEKEIGGITLIDEKGNKKTVTDAPIRGMYENGNYYVTQAWAGAVWSSVHNINTNKSYTIISTDAAFVKVGSDPYAYEISADFGEKMFGSKAAVKYYKKNSEKEEDCRYALVNFSTGKRISSLYTYMSSKNNGTTYLVSDSKGNWGYISSKGKKLAMFDDAGWFYGSGKYAPVIKSGKIYLIDSNMKQISKTIKADKDSGVRTLGDELFKYSYGGKLYLMTNKT